MLLGDKMKSSVNQKCGFLLFMLAIKTCNIEANTPLSFEHGHRTVDRQPAAMRTCLKTAGKGNSTNCLQTWTHMSENAQNIASFTRTVGAESAGLSS